MGPTGLFTIASLVRLRIPGEFDSQPIVQKCRIKARFQFRPFLGPQVRISELLGSQVACVPGTGPGFKQPSGGEYVGLAGRPCPMPPAPRNWFTISTFQKSSSERTQAPLIFG